WWGEWSSWSSCSRSCGGGVRSQGRHCLIQRSIALPLTSPRQTVGSSKQYQLCPSEACPSPSVSFKQHQCSQFNAKAFGRRYYQWVPLYPADYISISSKPCDLQCTTINGERQLLVPAQDGTFCRDTKHHGVCIDGTCQPVGCDGKLYSSMAVDRCGVCGGDGTSCQRVSGSYRKALAQLGYVFITNIPTGASDIQIIEKRKTENILALADEAGHFFFNGNSVFDNPQNFRVAGTVFKYRRPSSVFSDGLEYIMAQGPTLQGLNVMVLKYYNLNGKTPHITYEYTLALPPLGVSGAAPDPVNSYDNLTFNEVNEDGPPATNRSRGSAPVRPYDSQSHAQLREEAGTEEEVAWEVKTPSPPPPAAILVYRPADISRHNDVEQPPGPSGYRRSTMETPAPRFRVCSHLLTDQCPLLQSLTSRCRSQSPEAAPSLLQEDPNHQAQSGDQPGSQTVEQPTAETRRDQGSELPSASVRRLQSDTHSSTNAPTFLPSTEATLRGGGGARTARTPRPVHAQSETPADMYRWKVSAYAPCSSTCTTGIATSYALCVRYDGSEVDERFCDSVTRPEPTQEFCSGKECPPRWETSGWSQCSRTCGEGFQYRAVRCWKMLSPGLDSSVYDSLCLSHDLHKPASRKVCQGQSCGPQWEVSDWSECSARCGSRGVQTREVRCSTDMRLCNKSSQPIESQECEGPPCDRRWTVSDWGPCSGVCGEGRMARAVTCRSSGGVVTSEEQCDQSLRPLAIYPCGDRDCAPHWVEQEWQQCNATCGRGVRQRQVVCAGLEAGVFKEFPESSCARSNPPESFSSCFQRPCSKWFTTSWSQCTKTCGRGVQVREVKCYRGEDVVLRGRSCDSALRPEGRQSCQIQRCPPEPTASAPLEDSCRDKPTANCALVLKVKLCSHWYYRRACCHACQAARP
uniref:Si:ch211-267e7.3 n=1 Tax=Tetraodon nigroviridis TaxID=99883 RepID=H3CJC7_TETNG